MAVPPADRAIGLTGGADATEPATPNPSASSEDGSGVAGRSLSLSQEDAGGGGKVTSEGRVSDI